MSKSQYFEILKIIIHILLISKILFKLLFHYFFMVIYLHVLQLLIIYQYTLFKDNLSYPLYHKNRS